MSYENPQRKGKVPGAYGHWEIKTSSLLSKYSRLRDRGDVQAEGDGLSERPIVV